MIIDFPDTLSLVLSMEWGQQRAEMVFESPFRTQTLEIDVPRWTLLMTPKNFSKQQYSEWESILLQLQGRRHRLAVWHLDRPQPFGTMRGTMTFNGTHAQGDTTLHISAAGEGGKTLLRGDHLGFGSGTTQQVCKVKASATADGTGNITVEVESPLRNAFANGAAITWNKPKALFCRRSSEFKMVHSRGQVNGTPLDLVEEWRL